MEYTEEGGRLRFRWNEHSSSSSSWVCMYTCYWTVQRGKRYKEGRRLRRAPATRRISRGRVWLAFSYRFEFQKSLQHQYLSFIVWLPVKAVFAFTHVENASTVDRIPEVVSGESELRESFKRPFESLWKGGRLPASGGVWVLCEKTESKYNLNAVMKEKVQTC